MTNIKMHDEVSILLRLDYFDFSIKKIKMEIEMSKRKFGHKNKQQDPQANHQNKKLLKARRIAQQFYELP